MQKCTDIGWPLKPRRRFAALLRKFRPSSWVLSPVLTFLLLSPGYSGTADTPTKFQVIGSAPVIKGDFSAARNAAISDCLTAAVDAAVMTLLPRDALVKQFKTVGEAFSGKADKFIQEYKVFTESMVGAEYRVFIEAVVWPERIRAHLLEAGISEARRKLPKILLLIAETPEPGGDPVYSWDGTPPASPVLTETGIQEVLAENGYPIVLPSMETPGVMDILPVRGAELSEADSLELGKRLGAEVVVVGQGEARPGTALTQAPGFSREGSVTARALRVDTGEEVAGVSRIFTAEDPDDSKAYKDALFGAGRLAGTELSDQLAQNWMRKEQIIHSISLLIRGTQHLGNFVTFRRALVQLAGVKQMRLEEIRADEAVIRVVFQGTATALANTIARTAFETFEVLILETVPNRILLTLSHREPESGMTPTQTQ